MIHRLRQATGQQSHYLEMPAAIREHLIGRMHELAKDLFAI